jgi:hypothetical protein
MYKTSIAACVLFILISYVSLLYLSTKNQDRVVSSE